MNCVSTLPFLFLINGAASGAMRLARGLHKGCQLSPYLFFLYVEGLSSLITYAERKEDIIGFTCTSESMQFSSLLSVDVSLVFCKAGDDKCMKVKRILGIYERARLNDKYK